MQREGLLVCLVWVGAMAITRRSTAAAAQVVQPRFDAPETTKRATLLPPPSGLAANCVMASMARTALLVIGSRAGLRRLMKRSPSLPRTTVVQPSRLPSASTPMAKSSWRAAKG